MRTLKAAAKSECWAHTELKFSLFVEPRFPTEPLLTSPGCARIQNNMPYDRRSLLGSLSGLTAGAASAMPPEPQRGSLEIDLLAAPIGYTTLIPVAAISRSHASSSALRSTDAL